MLLAHPAVASAVGRELGYRIEYHARIGSTQARAREAAKAGGPLIVVADEQLAGQGTHGRTWSAPAGTSLLASWVLSPSPASPSLFAALAGVAVARAIESLGLRDARLKWPNDVELAGRKVAGALAHAASDGAGGVLVLGIGVNVHQRVEDFAPDLRATATSCAIAGTVVDRLALLARVTRELDSLVDPARRAAAMDEWRARSTLLGKAVSVRIEGRAPFIATATAIDDDGALVVHTPTRVERVVAGDVRLVQ